MASEGMRRERLREALPANELKIRRYAAKMHPRFSSARYNARSR